MFWAEVQRRRKSRRVRLLTNNRATGICHHKRRSTIFRISTCLHHRWRIALEITTIKTRLPFTSVSVRAVPKPRGRLKKLKPLPPLFVAVVRLVNQTLNPRVMRHHIHIVEKARTSVRPEASNSVRPISLTGACTFKVRVRLIREPVNRYLFDVISAPFISFLCLSTVVLSADTAPNH